MTKFDENYKKLNSKQKEAVDTIYGPVMVVAGPGTGKTQVIALRIANIFKKTDINPFNILCLTFTNSGVRAMRSRLTEIMGVDGYKVVIHTFHSFCSEIIGIYPERFIFAKRIEQMSDLEKILYLKEILDENENIKNLRPVKSPYYYVPKIIAQISNLKKEGFQAEKFLDLVNNELTQFLTHEEYYHQKGKYKGQMIGKYQTELKKLEKNLDLAYIYQKYQAKMVENGRYDFDDMILKVVSELEMDESFRADLQEKYMFLLVDEYQDTNGAQNKLIELLSLDIEQPNVFAVGDNDQSIYRFQGASLENLLFFADNFENAKIITLNECYRSSQAILAGARSMITNEANKLEDYLKIKKEYQTSSKVKTKIKTAEFEDGQIEMFFVAEEIEKLRQNDKNLNDVAIFYRNNYEATVISEVLDKFGINWRLTKGGNVLDSWDVIRLVNILKYINNIENDELLFKILNYDFLEINPADTLKIFSSRPKHEGVYSWLKRECNNLELINSRKICEWLEITEELTQSASNDIFVKYMQKVMEKTGLIKFVDKSTNRFERLTDLKSWFDFVKDLNVKDKELSAEKLIADIEEMKENGLQVIRTNLDFDRSAVNLMTAHASKGLEFDHVFICRLVEGVWSNKLSRDVLPVIDQVLTKEAPEEDIEEERRLFYVAMTRAKQNLYLTWSKKYEIDNSVKETNKSMLVAEIDDKWIEQIDTKKYHLKSNDWLNRFFAMDQKNVLAIDDDLIKKILEEYKLSPTGLNKYLKCPRKFFYEDIIRIPKAKSAVMAFGTAIHSSLENLYIDYRNERQLPDVTELLKYFKMALKKEILTKAEFASYLEEGNNILASYYTNYQAKFKIPLFNEYSFARSQVLLDNEIVLTGKVDRVELIENSSERVRVIDYKTSKPKSRKQILGETKEQDKDYFRQLVFYKLLGDTAGYFRYKIVECELDFVMPNDRGIFKKEIFEIKSKDVEVLKEEIRTTWKNIHELKFDCCQGEKECVNQYGKCEYWEMCHKA